MVEISIFTDIKNDIKTQQTRAWDYHLDSSVGVCTSIGKIETMAVTLQRREDRFDDCP